MRPAMVDLDLIRPTPANVRQDLGDLPELAASMREHGVQQPLVAQSDGVEGRWVLVDGERRYNPATMAGLPRVPCLILAAGTRDHTLTVMLASALHKRLEPLEHAAAFRALRNHGLSVAEIARRTGYSTSTVSSRLLLLDLPREAKEMVHDGRVTAQEAQGLARQVKAKRSGVARVRAPKGVWFTANHRLQGSAADMCDHADARTQHAGACGQCWEEIIRADERGEVDVITRGRYDEVAVQRRIDGDHVVRLTPHETDEAVRRLNHQGLSDPQIADRLGITDRTVLRLRQRTGVPATPATAAFRPGAA